MRTSRSSSHIVRDDDGGGGNNGGRWECQDERYGQGLKYLSRLGNKFDVSLTSKPSARISTHCPPVTCSV